MQPALTIVTWVFVVFALVMNVVAWRVGSRAQKTLLGTIAMVEQQRNQMLAVLVDLAERDLHPSLTKGKWSLDLDPMEVAYFQRCSKFAHALGLTVTAAPKENTNV